MKVYHFVLLIAALSVGLKGPSSEARPFPSARTAWVLPGGWEAPTDQETVSDFIAMYGSATAEMVKRWEAEHADVSVGGSTQFLAYNADHVVLAYAYDHVQFLQFHSVTDWLWKYAFKNGKDPEDFALHFITDTVLNVTKIGTKDTFWNGMFSLVGSTDSASDYGVVLNTNRDVFRGVAEGGALYIAAPVRFDTIHIKLRTPGTGSGITVILEYPSSVDTNFKVTEWSQITVISDTTNGFTKDGTIRFYPPADWKYACTYPPNGFYSTYLARGGGAYFVRIKAFGFSQRPVVDAIIAPAYMTLEDGEPFLGAEHTGTAVAGGNNTITLSASASSASNAYVDRLIKITSGNGTGQVRVITAYDGSTKVATVDRDWDVVPDSTSEYKVVRRVVRIPGWDPANDTNGDGYVDDTEFARRANPNASARFRYQARVAFPNAWSTSSAWTISNVWNEDYRNAVAQRWLEVFSTSGVRGFYQDDIGTTGPGSSYSARSGAASPAVLLGGQLAEFNGIVGVDDPTGDAFRDAWIQTLRRIKQITDSQWVGGNIANYNPYFHRGMLGLVGNIDWFVCEYGLVRDMSLAANTGAARKWLYAAFAAGGSKAVLMGHVTGLNPDGSNNTQAEWERSLSQMLAQYYLFQIPDFHYAQFWNQTASYGSGLTTQAYYSYWKAGVPRNYAYQPTKMMKVDIGVPANTMPPDKQPMQYIETAPPPYGDAKYGDAYWVIGDTVSTSVSVPWYTGGSTSIPVIPTYTYYYWVNPSAGYYTNTQGLRIPKDVVLAREYTRGLVLYRVPFVSGSNGYKDSTVTLNLPGTYRRVNYDGTLGPPIEQITLHGFDAAILVKDGSTSVPSVQISVSTDRSNPRPLDVVTVTITAINNGNGEATNVRVQHNIPRTATYVLGSLKVNGVSFPDPADTSKIDLTIPSIPAGGTATIQFQMVIR